MTEMVDVNDVFRVLSRRNALRIFVNYAQLVLLTQQNVANAGHVHQVSSMYSVALLVACVQLVSRRAEGDLQFVDEKEGSVQLTRSRCRMELVSDVCFKNALIQRPVFVKHVLRI